MNKRDLILFLILVALVIDILAHLPLGSLNAETFKLDDCITSSPTDKPAAFLHVVIEK
jgi:hypothetical protein